MREDLKCEYLWAKSSDDALEVHWSPLTVHAHDSMGISEKLWNEWIPEHTRSVISNNISGCVSNPLSILKFLSAAHDAGKATPAFQRKPIDNIKLRALFSKNLDLAGLKHDNTISDYKKIKHSVASQCILERNGIHRSLSCIIGSHHGNTPDKEDVSKLIINSYPNNTGFANTGWVSVQDSFIAYVASISELDLEDLKKARASCEAQILLSSIIIMSDWIASNEKYFPLTDGRKLSKSELSSRIEIGWKSVKIPKTWHIPSTNYSNLYQERFGFEPRPFQKELADIASRVSAPGIIIVEAPMGEGKTEASLIASEILSSRFGFGGAIFALPTQATSDGMFPRMKKWIDSVTTNPEDTNSIFLAHGKSKFNKLYTSISHIGWDNVEPNGEKTIIHEWFTGKKKGLLSDFAVGTVDHVLMCGLKMKHLALRHLALANKVVIIDECHAYDSYMGSYLEKAVRWLGAYNVPVIIMSATLFPSRRTELIKSYLGEKSHIKGDEDWVTSTTYPSITFTDKGVVKQSGCKLSSKPKNVCIKKTTDEELENLICEISKNGGYIGVICNTVSRSQKIYRMIRSTFPDDPSHLLHSRYTCLDRSEKESTVLSELSDVKRQKPPFRMFVVGTQVMEQSLDLDFDILITDLCPVDLLLQRIGRLHRHDNERPIGLETPICYVIDKTDGFEKGSEFVYGKFQLYNSRILLPNSIQIPSDICKLVHTAYSGTILDIDAEYVEDYRKSFDEMQNCIRDKENMARTFQICTPESMKDMIGWLKNNARDSADGSLASATVRDTNATLEVIALRKNGDETLSPISGDTSLKLQTNKEIDSEHAFMLAGCKLSIPSRFTSKTMINHSLAQLHEITETHIPDSWRNNGWLKDELFIVFDQYNTTKLNGTEIRYSIDEGLVIL